LFVCWLLFWVLVGDKGGGGGVGEGS